ncbi:MAG: hypothetical protein ABUT20_63315, partial [Bacteroidota bacterium]
GGYNRLVIGIHYSIQKKFGEDKPSSTIKQYTSALLGEIAYARGFKNSDFSFKISFTPILAGEKYKEIENAPFGISLCTRL